MAHYTRILAAEPSFEVVGEAQNSGDVLQRLSNTPTVVLLHCCVSELV
ncbi:MAG: hypothetical protein ABI824_17455 [Acidobacteriota bacterium]